MAAALQPYYYPLNSSPKTFRRRLSVTTEMFENFLWLFFSEEHQNKIRRFHRREIQTADFNLAVTDRQTNLNYTFYYETTWKRGTEYVRRFLSGNGWRQFCIRRELQTGIYVEFSKLPDYKLGVRVFTREEYDAAKILMEMASSFEKMTQSDGTINQHQANCDKPETTMDGLRQGLNSENLTEKLQTEQLRLTGVAQHLRRQLETCTAETSSLQIQIISLFGRLKSTGKVGVSLALKLEHELTLYVQCLQSTGLSLLNECIRTCANLHGLLERKSASEGSMESLARALKREVQNASDNVSIINHKMKNVELQMMHKDGTIDQLQQERTIDARQCCNSENLTNKLQVEQLRLAGAEHTAETISLRSENIYLFERLKSTGKVGGSSSVKLELELTSYVQCLQSKGLTLLNECIRTCANLHGVLERKSASEGSMESHSLVQHGMKIHEFRKGLEQLIRSLGKTASVLKEKADIASSEPELSDATNIEVLEDDLKSELKAEQLLTIILEDKVFFEEKELEPMQMQAELARALRSHDVLKIEIQDSADTETLSCVNHNVKNLELKVIQKDGTINQLQGDIQSYDEELTSIRRVLSKVLRERYLMWPDVQGYNEKNMLLNHEIESL